MTPIILASQSPRRIEILNNFSLPIEPKPHTFDERSVSWTGNGAEYTKYLATKKALSLVSSFPGHVIIGADTIVTIDGKMIGKPKDEQESFEILELLANRWHQVITGIAIVCDTKIQSASAETVVQFQPLNKRQIQNYLALQHWKDKAGGYAIQGSGSLLITSIKGCYYNVIGLPVVPLSELLSTFGIDLWSYLK